MPLHSPPPPTGTTTLARSGTSSSSSSPSEPWPATTSGSSNGWMNASPPSRERSRAETRHSSTDPPPRCTIAPSPRAASVFAIGASAGTNTSHGTPIVRAASATAWAWLPAEAATTPALQPCSPSAASFAAVRRALNEPVLWRFSAFSATMPPARSEIVRVESTGVRRAIVPTAARAAATSRPVTGEDSTVATRSGYRPVYPPDGRARPGGPRRSRRGPALGRTHRAPDLGRHRRQGAPPLRSRHRRGRNYPDAGQGRLRGYHLRTVPDPRPARRPAGVRRRPQRRGGAVRRHPPRLPRVARQR